MTLLPVILFIISTSEILNYQSGPDKIAYTIEDNRSHNEFIITLINDMDIPLCIADAGWPDENGFIFSHKYLSLEVGSEVFLQEYEYLSDCFDFFEEGICSIVVPAGERIEGRIGYRTFGLPQSLYDESKILRFFPIYTTDDIGCEADG